MKKTLIISCLLILSCVAFSQQIKSKNAEFDDYITLFRASGYELFSFDITELLNERYDIVFVKKEFLAGKEINSSILKTTPNKRLLTDFPESYRQKMVDEGQVIDTKTQAVYHAEKFSIGFIPSGNDSTRLMQIQVSDFFTMSKIALKLKGLSKKDSDELMFYYHIRPFKLNAFKEEEFIPLILLGSGWYDEISGMFRFCGANEIEPDMSSEILKDIPHHYVIGVRFVKKIININGI